MVRMEELVRVDSKGRITIPLTIREALDIREGMYVIVVGDKEKKEIVITPLPASARLIKLIMKIEDRPGVLAEITKYLADYGLDIVMTKCIVIKRGELAECEIVADVSRTDLRQPNILVEKLKMLEPVKNVEASTLTG
ncbi:AbrB/MazE/SpoVT family DNA-binding domain-containing protein [Thermogladius sp. 4427co]|uniref:AbrB/MazE/SpoVT family DNA-binding domain-containing protein n=1 Tax=Thermogladius sp. 4427co TaxID=3450718 RepID=UPI003F790241